MKNKTQCSIFLAINFFLVTMAARNQSFFDENFDPHIYDFAIRELSLVYANLYNQYKIEIIKFMSTGSN